MCPLLSVGATVQPRPLRRPEEQPPSAWGSVAAVEVAGRSGAVPETVGPRRAVLEQGSKRAAPKQGTSDHPVKKARVRSKM
jgi:hypothetical protein